MSQWKKDITGQHKRVHKRQWRRRACLVYFYKTLWAFEYGFLGADVYTAKPKGKFPVCFSCQAVGGVNQEAMLIKITKLKTLPDFKLYLEFEDGKTKIYDVKEDIEQTPGYEPLETIPGLFEQVQLHQSGGMIAWTPEIDLPCDILYEYGKDCEPMAAPARRGAASRAVS